MYGKGWEVEDWYWCRLEGLKANKKLEVHWAAMEIETVPVVSVNGLEVRTADRLLRFMRRHRPDFARFSAANDPRRGKPIEVL